MTNKYIYKVNDSEVILANSSFDKFWLSDNPFKKEMLPRHLNYIKSVDHSFFNLKNCVDFEAADLFVLGVPYNRGSNMQKSAVRHFPEVLRRASYAYTNFYDFNLKSMSGIYDVDDNKLLWQDAVVKDLGDMEEVFDQCDIQKCLDDVIAFTHFSDSKLLTIGGDHSLTFYAINGLKKLYPKKKFVLFQFDAHHDCGYSLKHRQENLDHANFVKYLLDDESIYGVIQFGVRGFRSREQVYKHPKLFQVSARDLRQNNISELLDELPIDFRSNELLGYVSFDTDAFDPKIFPLVDFPIQEGMQMNEVKNTLDSIYSLPIDICGLDIVEGKSGGEVSVYDPVIKVLIQLLHLMGKKYSLV
ncbi:arginase family protein [Alkalihalobacillus pseudalcaliphilus]|uniref:arginase family protein n=1 Tax=Alkalihalobacillus pseudalcaliphilus TaxID=79884 RepID=UPI00064D77EB|nr:arginase family protein [Alkalihalobacillus pseudalcaliphilus]KMK76749.1 hypothetical protein AB990_07485 [Alkalihalobacillus pseudalcaliphilus]